METNLIVPIIIAIVAIVPGVWALVEQINKDKRQTQTDMNLVRASHETAVQFANLRDDLAYTKYSIPDRIKSNIAYNDEIADKLWKKMYEKPVIIRCEHCNSPNVITSMSCTQCGAPLE